MIKKISFRIDYNEVFYVELETNKFEIDFLEMFFVNKGIKLKKYLNFRSIRNLC